MRRCGPPAALSLLLLFCLAVQLFCPPQLVDDDFRQIIKSFNEPETVTVSYKRKTMFEKFIAEEFYREKPTRARALEDIRKVVQYNSDRTPESIYEYRAAHEICAQEDACLPPFVDIAPLLATSPKKKIMACLVQKTMSTVLSSILCYLDQPEEFVLAKRSILREHPRIRFCAGDNEFRSMEKMRKSLKITARQLNAWKFLLLTRDPVDRFLSGFIDQCIRGLQFVQTGDPEVTGVDIHIYPQNWRCDLKRYHSYYTFIRYSNKPQGTLLRDLAAAFRDRNVSESSIRYITKSLLSGRTKHSTVTSATRKFLEHRLKTSPYLMELIVRLFYYDYIHLNYPIPDYTQLGTF
ncbi:unnamed protein product [Caenorhabditis auriculariae]|uniref:Sulfotransferase domain-containing protein n=1 Tax=Caenorhabditis auriculariae TaxID=2777116 RepID=A0A8S1H9G3_9PELO|nr:unnamed protein product [Caenorhabditis auriculariae]